MRNTLVWALLGVVIATRPAAANTCEAASSLATLYLTMQEGQYSGEMLSWHEYDALVEANAAVSRNQIRTLLANGAIADELDVLLAPYLAARRMRPQQAGSAVLAGGLSGEALGQQITQALAAIDRLDCGIDVTRGNVFTRFFEAGGPASEIARAARRVWQAVRLPLGIAGAMVAGLVLLRNHRRQSVRFDCHIPAKLLTGNAKNPDTLYCTIHALSRRDLRLSVADGEKLRQGKTLPRGKSTTVQFGKITRRIKPGDHTDLGMEATFLQKLTKAEVALARSLDIGPLPAPEEADTADTGETNETDSTDESPARDAA